jgi:glutathione S-transferase
MVRDHHEHRKRAFQTLATLDDAFAERAFLCGRIGYADFALYGQLIYLNLSPDFALPEALQGLHAFYGRMDRISANVDAT